MGSRSLRVGLVGIGNCASSLVQGLYLLLATRRSPPLWVDSADLGGYRVSDIVICAAFDITTAKVGRDVAEAILARPNDTAPLR